MDDAFANVLPRFLTDGEKLRMRLVKKNFLGRYTVMDRQSRVLRVSELNRLTRGGIFFTDVRLDLFNSVQDLDLVENKYLKKVTVTSLIASVDRHLTIFYDCPNIEELVVTQTYEEPCDLGTLLDSLPNVRSVTIRGNATTRFLRPSNKLEHLNVRNLEGSPEFLKSRLRTLRAHRVDYDPSLLTRLESLVVDETYDPTTLTFGHAMPYLKTLRLLNLDAGRPDLGAIARSATNLETLEVDVITDEFEVRFPADFRLAYLCELETNAVVDTALAQSCPLLTCLKCHSFLPGSNFDHLVYLVTLDVFDGEPLYQSTVRLPRLRKLIVGRIDHYSDVGAWVAAQTHLAQLHIRTYEKTSLLQVPDSLETLVVEYSNQLQTLDSLTGKKKLREIKFGLLPDLLFLPLHLSDSLQEVDLREVHSLQNLTALSHKPNLKKVHVSNAHNLRWDDLVLPGLAELCVYNCDTSTTDFKMFPNLVSLRLFECKTVDDLFQMLPTKLETLELVMLDLTNLTGVGRLAHLKTLNVKHNFNLLGGSELASLTRLQTLELDCTSVGDLSFLSSMACLRYLSLCELMCFDKSFLNMCGAVLRDRIDCVKL